MKPYGEAHLNALNNLLESELLLNRERNALIWAMQEAICLSGGGHPGDQLPSRNKEVKRFETLLSHRRMEVDQ